MNTDHNAMQAIQNFFLITFTWLLNVLSILHTDNRFITISDSREVFPLILNNIITLYSPMV